MVKVIIFNPKSILGTTYCLHAHSILNRNNVNRNYLCIVQRSHNIRNAKRFHGKEIQGQNSFYKTQT